MTDAELLQQFEAASLPADRFHHAEHVRVTFAYLCRFTVPEVLKKISDALRHFAAANGKSGRYHETITWAYVFLVNQRRQDKEESWEEFARRNCDLLDWKDSVLKKYYSDETLGSAEARQRFVLPDRYAQGRSSGLAG